MADKRVEITNVLCRKVQLLIKGGATNKEAGKLVGVSAATVSRIRTANYDPFKYQQNTEARRGEEKKTGTYACVYTGVVEDKSGIELTPDGPRMKSEQIPGQVAMELLPTQEQAKETTDLNKLLRFLAGKTDLLGNQLSKYDRLMREMGIMMCDTNRKLDKLNDNLCQILRRMDKC